MITFNKYKLKELIKINNGKDYKHLSAGDIPVYGSGGLMSNVSACIHDGEAILLPRKGSLGNIMYVNGPFWTVDTMYWAVVNSDIAYPKYLFYYLSLLDLSHRDSGSTLPSMTFDAYYSLVIDLPPMNVQKKVGDYLFLLSKKMENNNAIISELESMAKDIYDYWFVQYDFPDENGKPYKSSGGKMVWNDELKREVPEGWKANYISNLVSLKNGINYDKANQGTGKEYQIINVRNISNSSLCIDKSKLDKIILSPTNADRYLIEKNSILIARSGIPGAIRIIDIDKSSNIIFCGFIILCTPNNPDYMLYYLYSLKKYEGTNATKTGGSTLQNVSQDTIGSLCILIPESTIVERFNSIIEQIHKRIMNALEENAELTSLCDFLLPLLMNGQVKIGEVEP